MARGGAGAFGGKKINSPSVWLTFCALFLARARRPPAPARAAQPRPARAALVLDLALVLQPRRRSSGARRSPTRRSSTCSPAASGSARATGLRASRGRSGRSGCSRRRAIFLVGFRVGLNVEAQSNVIDVGLRGRVGAHRIANGADAVRPLAGRGGPQAVRHGRRRGRDPRAHPDQRPLRVRRTRAATRTGRSPTSRTCPATASSAGAGSGTSSAGGALDLDALRRALRCSGSRSSASASAAPRLAAPLAFAWAAYPFTLYVSNSNTNDAIMPALPDLGLLARARPPGRAALLSRSPAGRSSRRSSSRRSG